MTELKSKPLLISGGRVVDPTQDLDRVARLLIVDGCIAAIDPTDGDLPDGVERIDATDRIVAPGLVDLNVQLGEPGHEEDETIATGLRAALRGGFTTVACSASTRPPLDSPAAVQFVAEKAARLKLAKVVVLACVSKDRRGEELAEIGALVSAGAVGLSDAPRPLENTTLLKRALEYCSMFDVPVLDHPEVRSMSGGGVMHEGQTQLITGLRPMPAEAEDLATSRDLRMVEATGGRLHLTSISTAGSVELCRRAKSRNISFTAGIHAANFHLLDEQLRSFDSNCKVNPPLRAREDVSDCCEGLADGTIEVISSGHRPRSLEKKMQELDLAPFGMTALETCLAQAITHLIAPGILDWSQLIAKLSTNPARVLGLHSGTLAIGAAADIVIINPDLRWTPTSQSFVSRSNNSPLIGIELQGRAEKTIVAGEVKT
jgi:dihydroorotase